MRPHNRLTVEKLGNDHLDVGELRRIGIFGDGWVTLQPSFRWPKIRKMHVARYLIRLELHNQVTPQLIRVSWTRCHLGGARPWLHCPHCGRRVGKLFRMMAGYFCRQCTGNPIYACQGKSTQSRRHFEACKIRLLLNGIASFPGSAPRNASLHLCTIKTPRSPAAEMGRQPARKRAPKKMDARTALAPIVQLRVVAPIFPATAGRSGLRPLSETLSGAHCQDGPTQAAGCPIREA
jgi:hypothetical protein